VLFRRARHVVSEIARVEPIGVALATGDTATLAEVMREAHLSLSQNFDVSLPPIDPWRRWWPRNWVMPAARA
jgi:galactokinase